jgi:hypothetical protein
LGQNQHTTFIRFFIFSCFSSLIVGLISALPATLGNSLGCASIYVKGKSSFEVRYHNTKNNSSARYKPVPSISEAN